MFFSVVIPTYNGGSVWLESAKSIAAQSVKPNVVYVIDSSSKDNTVDIAESYGYKVKVIPSAFLIMEEQEIAQLRICPSRKC